MKKKTGIVFSHTHWDIEWYMPYRSFRFWLVDWMDSLVKICERNKNFKTFVLDGQVAPVEHYLSVKPENEKKIRKLIAEGRLSIGPFYTQFDEWLVSPEGIIRNCLYGNRQGRKFGRIMKAGYLPDNFGHPFQMPQILKGFGIDSLIFMRGMPDGPKGMANEFYWQGLDGTKILGIHLAGGYVNAHLLGATKKIPMALRTSPYGDMHFGYEWLFDRARDCNAEQGAAGLIEIADRIKRGYPSGVIPLANGCDHCPPQEQIGEMIERANRMQSEIHFVHGNCEQLVNEVKKRGKKYPVFRGEFWGARHQYILTGTLTTRSYIKQNNFSAEALLEKYAEPLASLAALSGNPYPAALLDEAWRLMFLNQAHDSIHGSSVDPVHLEMTQRYAAIRQIAVGICHEALKHTGAVPATFAGAKQIVAYNPAAGGRMPCAIDLWVDQEKEAFHIEDDHGHILPMQVVENARVLGNGRDTNSLWPGKDARHVLFSAPIHSHGIASFALVPGLRAAASEFKNTPHSIENEFLRVDFVQGTICIHDKVAQRHYKKLNLFEDEADAGDAWDFSEPWKKNRIYRSVEFPARCRLIEDGPVRSTLLIEHRLRIPGRFDGEKRSGETVPMTILARVSLNRSDRHVTVCVTLNNQGKDHRLRLKCPTGIKSKLVKSQGHFGIIERPLRNPYLGKDWLQPPPQTFHFREWVAADDGRHGLAIACRGLYEYEAHESPAGINLYVTLMRCIGVMSKDNLRTRRGLASAAHPIPGAQCPGEQNFEYAFIPYSCDKNRRAPFLDSANAFLYPPIAHLMTGGRTGKPELTVIKSPLFSLQPSNLVVSCFKRAEDGKGYILRFWENEGKGTVARLNLADEFTEVSRTNLNEDIEAKVRMENGSISFKVKPYEIVTLKIGMQDTATAKKEG